VTGMGAVKHGLFQRGFMVCDRCVLQARCETFVPGGECRVEQEAFDGPVAELTRQYLAGWNRNARLPSSSFTSAIGFHRLTVTLSASPTLTLASNGCLWLSGVTWDSAGE
jgi:hypothetical protein